jgi:hypothetical protein
MTSEFPDKQAASDITFQAYGDGKLLWSSQPTKRPEHVQDCTSDVSQVDVLELRVNCPGGLERAWAVWLDPYVRPRAKDSTKVESPIDLLKVIDPKKNMVKGKWAFEGKTLVMSSEAVGILEIPYHAPDEYTLQATVELKEAMQGFGLGLVVGNRRCMLCLDAFPELGYLSGLSLIDGKHLGPTNPTTAKGKVFQKDKALEVVATVSNQSIRVALDGKPLLWYFGGSNKLSLLPLFATPDSRALFVHNWVGTGCRITKLEIDTAVNLTPTYLADMPEGEVKKGPWELGKGTVGNPEQVKLPIKVGGVMSPKGLGLHPPSKGFASVTYLLKKEYSTLIGAGAMNDKRPEDPKALSPVTFQVLGDGKILWSSTPLQASGEKQDFDIVVKGVEVLELRTVCDGEAGHCYAVWVEPHLLK